MSRDLSLSFYEFFAGGGMARVGLGSGWTCSFANDFDPGKAAAYRENFGGEDLVEADVWSLGVDDLPGLADLAWASSPCQDFSLAGNRVGLEGGRSSAFFGFWRLVEQLNRLGRAPSTVVLENVAGLLTSHSGRDFATLVKALHREGYWFGAVEIDAARFVPQSRPRVFIVATRAMPGNALSQIEPTVPFHSKRIVAAFGGLSEELQRRWIWWHLPFPPAQNAALESVLEPDAAVPWLTAERTTKLVSLLNHHNAAKLAVAQSRRERVVGTLFRRMRTEKGVSHQRAELRFDGLAGCLRTPGGGSSKQFLVLVEGKSVRARSLTARESARLMSLPETYVLPSSHTRALHLVGDGVVVRVVDFLRRQLLEPLARLNLEERDGQEEERRRARA